MVSYGQFSEILLPIPSVAEQQKIADCLSSIDELIATEACKLDALNSHKKGLMKQLFPAQGGTFPGLRFYNFGGAWKEYTLGSISHTLSSGKDKNELDGTYDLYGSTGVIGKTSRDTYSGQFILVARVGANAGLLTKATGRFGVTDNTLVIHLKTSVNIDFIYYLLKN